MGFDVELVDPAVRKESNMCPHCRLILEEPMQTEDGVRLCRGCLLQIEKKPGGKCSCCDVQVEKGQYYADRAAQREVNVIEVFCKHKKLGCPWQGKLKDYNSHVAGCEFAGIPCPNTGCREMVLTNQLQSHLAQCQYRLVTCTFCHEQLVAKNLEEHHSTVCQMIPVSCERCGEEVGPRHQLADHLRLSCRLEECLVCSDLVDRKTSRNTGLSSSSPPSLTSSDDSSTASRSQPHQTLPGQQGSSSTRKTSQRSKQKRSQKGERVSVAADEGAEPGTEEEEGLLHLSQAVTVFRHFQTLAAQHGQLRSELKSFSQATETRLSEAGSHGNTAELEERMRGSMERLEQQLTEMTSQIQAERERRKTVEQRLDEAMRELSKVQELAKTAQREAEESRRMRVPVGGASSSGGAKGGGLDVAAGDMEARLFLLEQRTESQERESSTLKVSLSELELQLQASLASTHNGSFLWRIPEVARRRRDAIDERITSIYSPPFYSGRNGYKMCVRAYLNGDGSGYKTHFSVFFVLMRGEFDPLLKWPFEYKVSLILVDQEQRKHIVQTFKPTAESSSFKRPTSDMNVASGCPQFSKLSVLDNPSYVKDDVLYLKCIIDTSRIFHP